VIHEGKNEKSLLARHVRNQSCCSLALPWLLSLFAAFLCSSMGLVQADPLLGVCFVTSTNSHATILAVFLPIALATAVYASLFVSIALNSFRSYPKVKERDGDKTVVLASVFAKAALLLAVFLVLGWGFVACSAISMKSAARYENKL
jgi:cytochrome c oxidase subunit IV